MTTFTYFEPLEDGHCVFWARMVLKAAAEDPRVARLQLVGSSGLVDHLCDTTEKLNLEATILPPKDLVLLRDAKLMRRGKAQWAFARSLLARHGGQLFLPFMDHAIYGSILDRKVVNGQISGIIFRPPNAYNYPHNISRSLDAFRRWATYAAAQRPSLKRLFTLDECAASRPCVDRTSLLTFSPDPAPDLTRIVDKASQEHPDGRQVFLLFGALAHRKGIFALLDAVTHIPPQAQRKIVLRFVGRVDPEDAQEFHARVAEVSAAHPNIRIEVLDEFVSEDSLAIEVAKCDVILAPYQNHVGSSGVMFWAAAARKPLIAQKTGLMGFQVSHYNLGVTVDTMEPKAIADSLITPPVPHYNTAFLKNHSEQAFTQAILDGVLS